MLLETLLQLTVTDGVEEALAMAVDERDVPAAERCSSVSRMSHCAQGDYRFIDIFRHRRQRIDSRIVIIKYGRNQWNGDEYRDEIILKTKVQRK